MFCCLFHYSELMLPRMLFPLTLVTLWHCQKSKRVWIVTEVWETVFVIFQKMTGRLVYAQSLENIIIFKILFIYLFIYFWPHCMACGILLSWPGVDPGPPAMKPWVLTTGPPGKSLRLLILLPWVYSSHFDPGE